MTEALHDKGYKRIFSNKLIFQQLVETFVTEDWVKECDFENCQKVDKSFISGHYKETESDIIYQVKFKNEDAYIYLLLEFQSSVPWYMALRMLNYVSNFYMDYIETNKKTRKLPPLFPLVLYNGDDKWTAATDFNALLEKPDLLKHYAPQLHYFKIAENEYSTQTLLEISNLVSILFLAEKKEELLLVKTQLRALFEKQEDKQAISIILNWFKQLAFRGKRSSYDYAELDYIYQSNEEVDIMLETTMDSFAHSFFIKGKEEGERAGLQKGREEGIEKGIEKGIKKGRIETLILLLESRFGELTAEQKTKIVLLKTDKINQILKKIWLMQNLQDFFQSVE